MPHSISPTFRVAATTLAVAIAIIAPVTAAASAAPPQLGQPCAGAEIGRKVVDDQGRTIMCNNYRWQLYTGQRPSHPWADDQR